VHGLLVAGQHNGSLCYLARVRTGFTDAERRRLADVLAAARGRARPVVACPEKGLWLEPELFCQVSYLERTRAGRLRGASFHGWLTE
jgi:bifunctional non-homologous end joining protein LigD